MVSVSGLDRLWRSSRSHAASASATSPMARPLTRKREDIEHASRGGFHRQILDGIGEAERAGGVARIHLSSNDRARPAADAGDDRNILAAVRTAVADRLADDPAARLELPQE